MQLDRDRSDLASRRLEAARAAYVTKRPRSAALAAEAVAVLPGGHTRTVLHFDPFPFRVAAAHDATLIDVDGHQMLDLLGNYTAGLAGHTPSVVAEAVTAAMANGWTLGATHPNEIRFAQLMVQRFPALEQVRFTNSGTEANLMAIATARHVTRRNAIIVFGGGYHGGVLTYGSHGRGINVPFDVEIATFNDLESVRAIVERRGSEVAAILVEPMLGSAGCLPGEPDFLGGLRSICDTNGSLLIFDEVMTSRLSSGGAQLLYGVLPDLATFGKYLAGGMSFGAFGGRADVLSVFDTGAVRTDGLEPLGHAGTFNNNVLTMAAGIATLEHTLTSDAVATLNERGERLRVRLNDSFVESGLPMSVTGLGSLMNVHPVPGPVRCPNDLVGGDEALRELFFFDMLDAGFYLARRGFIALSIPIDDQDLDAFALAVEDWCRSW